jgi:hypothetical protein
MYVALRAFAGKMRLHFYEVLANPIFHELAQEMGQLISTPIGNNLPSVVNTVER